MAIPQNFRSALGGFNREDVVQYLEYMNSRHQQELNQLNTELEELRNKPQHPELFAQLAHAQERCTALEGQVAQLTDRCQQLEQAGQAQAKELEEATAKLQEVPQPEEQPEWQAQVEDLTTELRLAQSRCQELERRLAEQGEALQQAQAKVQLLESQKAADAQALQEAQSRRQAEDYTFYRRTVDAERQARQQSDLIYHQAVGVLGQTSALVDGASADLAVAAERAMEQLNQLQAAIAGSRQTLQDAASIMQAIKPTR